MKALEDLKNLNEEQVRQHIETYYLQTHLDNRASLPSNLEILIAYESEGSYGCDSSSWFLIRNKDTGELYENHASHCSCYGFEGQWSPEPTTLEYLKSNKFYVCIGGYDNTPEKNKEEINKAIAAL